MRTETDPVCRTTRHRRLVVPNSSLSSEAYDSQAKVAQLQRFHPYASYDGSAPMLQCNCAVVVVMVIRDATQLAEQVRTVVKVNTRLRMIRDSV